MKTTKEAKKTRKSIGEPRHKIAAIKIGRLVGRTAKLAARYARYGTALSDSLKVAQGALEAATRYLEGLPDEFQPPNGNGGKKSEKAKKEKKPKKAKPGVDVESVKKALGALVADAQKVTPLRRKGQA